MRLHGPLCSLCGATCQLFDAVPSAVITAGVLAAGDRSCPGQRMFRRVKLWGLGTQTCPGVRRRVEQL